MLLDAGTLGGLHSGRFRGAEVVNDALALLESSDEGQIFTLYHMSFINDTFVVRLTVEKKMTDVH